MHFKLPLPPNLISLAALNFHPQPIPAYTFENTHPNTTHENLPPPPPAPPRNRNKPRRRQPHQPPRNKPSSATFYPEKNDDFFEKSIIRSWEQKSKQLRQEIKKSYNELW